jgi:hypothetical protein
VQGSPTRTWSRRAEAQLLPGVSQQWASGEVEGDILPRVYSMDFSTLTAPVATVLGAVVGLTGGVIGGLLTVWHPWRLERDKAMNARVDALAKRFAGAVQQLTISSRPSLDDGSLTEFFCADAWTSG